MAAETAARRWWQDPWTWLLVAAALPMVLHSVATPLGEPFADDFLFLRRALLPGPQSLLDGGGSPLYWRPLGRQIYFGLLADTIVSHPRWIAALHVVLIVASAWLVYRALRTRWPASWSAAAAAFPLLVDADRMLVAWPSHFQNVGALFFAALALHEAARARAWSAAAALLASLLCKEVAALTGLLLPWLPGPSPSRRWRVRTTLILAAAIAAWGVAYLAVARHAGVGFAHQFGEQSAAMGTPIGTRLAWAVVHSARSALSMPAGPGPHDRWVAAALVAVALAACAVFATRRDARARLGTCVALAAWGVAWFLAATVPLVEVYPAWSAERCVFAGVGLGIALSGLVAAAHPTLLVALVALRLVTFVLTPSDPLSLPTAAAEPGAEFEFRHMARLQRLVAETRTTLARRFPALPEGSAVGRHYVPPMVLHAFAGDAALQVWYRDHTLRWIGFDEFRNRPGVPVAAFVEYQPHGDREAAIVETDAVRGLLAALERIRAARWSEAIAALDSASAVQRDRGARVFLGTIAAKRAVCLSALGRAAEAAQDAERALELWPENLDSRYTLAELRLDEQRYAEAEALLVTQLGLYPGDAGARELLGRVRAAWAERAR